MLPAYALDALNAQEAREIEAYIKEHRDLRDELDDWRETASLLAYAAPIAEPSSAVRERLFENIRSQKQSSSVEEIKPVSNVIPFPTKQTQRRWNTIQLITALAASVAIVLLSVLLWTTLQNNRANESQIAELKNRLNETQKRIEEQNRDIALLTSADSNIVALKGLGTAPNAVARLAYDRKTGNAVLIAENLPSIPAGKAYQIWYITDKPTPGKTFKPDASGKATLRDLIPSGSLQASVFAVTIEDEKGATSPTLNTMSLKSGS
jgi:anti-sigma-K factor RskA